MLSKFLEAYPQIVKEAEKEQGALFNFLDYPSTKELKSKFQMKLFLSQVPCPTFESTEKNALWAVDLGAAYVRDVNEIIFLVMQDLSERVIKFSNRIRNSCIENPQEIHSTIKRKKIYESTLFQAKELCQVLEKFNLTQNAKLEYARLKLASTLNDVTINELRKNSKLRVHVKQELDQLLINFKPLNARRLKIEFAQLKSNDAGFRFFAKNRYKKLLMEIASIENISIYAGEIKTDINIERLQATINSLKVQGIIFVGDWLALEEDEKLKIPNLGRKTLTTLNYVCFNYLVYEGEVISNL